jgi:septal ring factor EnvC (AmiA/AmiB activator)
VPVLTTLPSPHREELTNMTQGNKALTVVVVAALGLWGCAQGNNADSAERIRQLENECKVLKDDYRSVASARDRLRQQVADLEGEKGRLQKVAEEKQALARERDELVQQVSSRTSERDAVQGQLDQVRKGLRSLLGQAEASAGTTPAPALSATPPENPSNKS